MKKNKYFRIGVHRDLPDEVYNETCKFAFKETQEYVEFLDIGAHVHYYNAGLISVIFDDAFHSNLDFAISRKTGNASVCDAFFVVRCYVETNHKFYLTPRYTTDIDGGPKSISEYIKSKIDKELKNNVAIASWDGPEVRYLRHDVCVTKELFNCRFGTPVTPKKVIFNDPATIIYWSDGTKTVVKKQKGDAFKKETGLAMCYVKKFCGNNTSRGLNDILSLAGTRKKPEKKKGAK